MSMLSDVPALGINQPTTTATSTSTTSLSKLTSNQLTSLASNTNNNNNNQNSQKKRKRPSSETDFMDPAGGKRRTIMLDNFVSQSHPHSTIKQEPMDSNDYPSTTINTTIPISSSSSSYSIDTNHHHGGGRGDHKFNSIKSGNHVNQ